MAVFFSGVFNPNVYFTDSGTVERLPRPADNEGRRRYTIKPTGLVDRPRTVQDRVDQTAEIAGEIEAEARGELQATAPPAAFPPVELMSQAEIDRELGVRLRDIARLQAEEDEEFLMLMAMIL